ncbi:MAG: DUF547 domain-containing protein [Spirochaetota bacterium]
MFVLISLLANCQTAAPKQTPSGEIKADVRVSHQVFTSLLQETVKEGMVDYKKIQQDKRLQEYCDLLAKTNPDALASEKEKLVYWINVYNAFTLKVILENYPLKSISQLHFSGNLYIAYIFSRTVWDTYKFKIYNKTYTLNYVEHEILRKQFKDFRIHAAIVCASIGCPPLRSEAFTAEKVDQQLDSQMKTFLSQTAKNRYDAEKKVLYLSPIFSWFEEDFTKGDKKIADVLLPYWPESSKASLQADKAQVSITHTHYDWNLNEQK